MNVWDKLEANLYKNQDPYPIQPRKPRLGDKATPAEHRAHADALEAYEAALQEFKQQEQAWRVQSGELESQFQTDLEAHYDMTGHPKAGLLYWKAYDRGHSGGMAEVANVYSDLVELVK